FFFRFNKVPFTCSYSSSKVQMVALAAGYLYGFTMYVQIAANLKRAVSGAPSRMAVFLGVSAAVFAVLRKYRRRTAIIYHDEEAGLLSLSADTGYWRSQSTVSNPRHPRNPRLALSGFLQDLR